MEIGSNYGKTLNDLTSGSGGQVQAKSLDQQDFLKVMIEQMRQQNPLDPQDNGEFFSQIAQFNTLDTMREIATALKSLSSVSELANASSMVGRTVTASIEIGPDPETHFPRPPEVVTGVVDRVTFGKGGATVHIGDRAVPATAISEVS